MKSLSDWCKILLATACLCVATQFLAAFFGERAVAGIVNNPGLRNPFVENVDGGGWTLSNFVADAIGGRLTNMGSIWSTNFQGDNFSGGTFSGTFEGNAGNLTNYPFLQYTNVVYVHNSVNVTYVDPATTYDGVKGKTPENPFRTLNSAITRLNNGEPYSPASGNRCVIHIIDDGEYLNGAGVTNFLLPAFVDLYAPNATLGSSLILSNSSAVLKRATRAGVTAGEASSAIQTIGGTNYINVKFVDVANSALDAIVVTNANYTFIRADNITTVGGAAIKGASTNAEIRAFVNRMQQSTWTADGEILKFLEGCEAYIYVNTIHVASNATAIVIESGSQVYIKINDVECGSLAELSSTEVFVADITRLQATNGFINAGGTVAPAMSVLKWDAAELQSTNETSLSILSNNNRTAYIRPNGDAWFQGSVSAGSITMSGRTLGSSLLTNHNSFTMASTNRTIVSLIHRTTYPVHLTNLMFYTLGGTRAFHVADRAYNSTDATSYTLVLSNLTADTTVRESNMPYSVAVDRCVFAVIEQGTGTNFNFFMRSTRP